MEKNIDFVAFRPQEDTSWTFYIKGKAKTISEVYHEILGITEKVLEFNEGFFVPTKIEYNVLTYSEDLPANRLFAFADRLCGFKIKPLDRIHRDLESDMGISYHELEMDVQSIETPKDVVREIRRIEIDGKTKFVLKGRDGYIDMGSKGLYASDNYKKVISLQEVLDSQTGMNPLTIDIYHDSLKGHNEYVNLADPAYYQIVFRANTDMWFENTEIGLANRNRLRNVLRKVYDNFDVVFTLFLSDRFSEERLKDVVFGQD